MRHILITHAPPREVFGSSKILNPLQDFSGLRQSLGGGNETLLMKNNTLKFLKKLEPLRIMLVILALILIIFAQKSETQAVYEGLAIIPTLIFPALVPMLFMGLLLDALMSRVRQVDLTGEERKRYRFIMFLNLGLALLLLLTWLPFFLSLGR